MSIMVSVPYFKPHRQFLPHFIEWYAANKVKHDLRLNFQMFRALHHAQSEAVVLAEKMGCTHILWTEDDHWGYPIDGLDELLAADKDVIGFPSYHKTHPYTSMTFRKRDKSISLIEGVPNLAPIYQGMGQTVEKVDLLPWSFLLTKVDVFKKLKDNPFAQWGQCPTDSYFCQYCADVGIDIHVHFGFTISHGDVAVDEIPFYRRLNDSLNSYGGKFTRESAEDADGRIINPYKPEYVAAMAALNNNGSTIEDTDDESLSEPDRRYRDLDRDNRKRALSKVG